jgi:DNA polymerase mu
MASKRASSRSPSPALRSAQSSPQGPSKRPKGAPGILASHRIFILQPKLSQTDISEIFDLADSADADVVSSPDEADVVITAIGMRKRLERHIDWNLAVSVVLSLYLDDRILKVLFDHTETKGSGDARLVA